MSIGNYIPYKSTIKNTVWKTRAWLETRDSVCWLTNKKYTEKKVKDLLGKTNIFFILSTGRSGTQFFSTLLNKANENIFVGHEPDFLHDIAVMEKSKNSAQYPLDYLKNFRSISIYKRINVNNVENYGEVTGTLRYHVGAIQQVFPKAKILLMTRDGRDVLRSVLGFSQFYNRESKGAYNLKPQPGEKYYDCWDSMSRFEKLCWSWMHSNEFMIKYLRKDKIIHFEKVINDFEYFKTHVLDQIGLTMSEQVWFEEKAKKSKNTTKKFAYPHWTDWSQDEIAIFRSMCGPTMEKLGYEVNM